MNLDIVLALAFYFIILIIFFWKRDKFVVQNKIFIMYRTKIGLSLMDWLAKKVPRLLNLLGYLSIFIGFIAMAVIVVMLIWLTGKLVFVPGSDPGLAPILPGVQVSPDLPVLGFWHWIISIFVLALVHEFFHGVYSRLNNIPVKSSGVAFLGPILAAFVEPDEEILSKKSKKAQLEVFSAGPFANFLTAGFFILILSLILNPLISSLAVPGLEIVDVSAGSPIDLAGIMAGDYLMELNNVETKDTNNFRKAVVDLVPGVVVKIRTDKSEYSVVAVENPDNPSVGFLGFKVTNSQLDKDDHPVLIWIYFLVFWGVILNIGVGLFNLLPLGPVDGGRMFLTGISVFIKDNEKANKLYSFMTVFMLLLVFINILPWLWKLILYLIGIFV